MSELTQIEKLQLDGNFIEIMERFDAAEAAIASSGADLIDFELKHTFTNGLYSRKIFMPAGSLLTSKIHATEHQFVILEGVATVWDHENGTQILRAPYTGITKPGTRRLLFINEDSTWITFHPTDKFTPEEVEADIIWRRIPNLKKEETHELAT